LRHEQTSISGIIFLIWKKKKASITDKDCMPLQTISLQVVQ